MVSAARRRQRARRRRKRGDSQNTPASSSEASGAADCAYQKGALELHGGIQLGMYLTHVDSTALSELSFGACLELIKRVDKVVDKAG